MAKMLLLTVLLLEFGTSMQQSMGSEESLNVSSQRLIRWNKYLCNSLDSAQREVDHFLINRTISSADKTIDIFRKNIKGRELYIDKVRIFTGKWRARNLAPSVMDQADIFNVTLLEFNLNQTRKELSKISSVRDLYLAFIKMHAIVNKDIEECSVNKLLELMRSRTYLLELMRNFTDDVSVVNDFIKRENLTEVLTNDWIEQLLDLEYWEKSIESVSEGLRILGKERSMRIFLAFLEPCLFVIIFAIGFIGNGTILVTYARKVKIRTYENMIFVNLAIADLASLIVNLPVFYLYKSRAWGSHSAKPRVLLFSQTLCFGLCAFSTLALCLQRFSTTLKLSMFTASVLRQSTQKSCFVVLGTVWILSFCCAVISSTCGEMNVSNCLKELQRSSLKLSLFHLMVYCVVPLTIMVALSVCTVRHFKLRSRTIPKNIPDAQKIYLKTVLARSTKIVILSQIVFAVSFVPHNVFELLQSLLQFGNGLTMEIIGVFSYCCIFVNSCYNPVALYVVSGTFRHHVRSFKAAKRPKIDPYQFKLRKMSRPIEPSL